MKIVVGLGNPGTRYAGTRHNVGFDVIDVIAESESGAARGQRVFQRRFEAETAEVGSGEEKLLLIKPQLFMNLSGRSVRQAVDFYRVELADVLVVCDDVNLPLGKLRIRREGTAGGHNGLKDIQRHLGTKEYARLRVGVGAAEGRDLADHVLDRFSAAERKAAADAIIRGSQAVMAWAKQGIENCMNQFN